MRRYGPGSLLSYHRDCHVALPARSHWQCQPTVAHGHVGSESPTRLVRWPPGSPGPRPRPGESRVTSLRRRACQCVLMHGSSESGRLRVRRPMGPVTGSRAQKWEWSRAADTVTGLGCQSDLRPGPPGRSDRPELRRPEQPLRPQAGGRRRAGRAGGRAPRRARPSHESAAGPRLPATHPGQVPGRRRNSSCPGLRMRPVSDGHGYRRVCQCGQCPASPGAAAGPACPRGLTRMPVDSRRLAWKTRTSSSAWARHPAGTRGDIQAALSLLASPRADPAPGRTRRGGYWAAWRLTGSWRCGHWPGPESRRVRPRTRTRPAAANSS